MNQSTLMSGMLNQFFIATIFIIAPVLLAGPETLDTSKEALPPPPSTTDNQWHFNVGSPGWLAGLTGTVGLQGVNTHVDVPFDRIIQHVDSLMSLSAEVRKGRFGVYGDFLYMDLSDPVYPKNIISKADIAMSQYLVDGEVYYRVLEGPRGWIDLRAGARYTNVYTNLELTRGTPSRIGEAADDFVTALPGDVKGLLDRLLNGALDGRNPPLPVPPLGFAEKTKLVKFILAAKRIPDRMQRRQKIVQILNSELNQTFRLTEYWFDPYIGISGQYALTKAFYLTGRVDVGGFGAGSDITTQVSAGLGCHITRSIYSELGFRYLYTDYEDDSNRFVWRTSTYGPQITTGITF
jgi:hypothetical protein